MCLIALEYAINLVHHHADKRVWETSATWHCAGSRGKHEVHEAHGKSADEDGSAGGIYQSLVLAGRREW